MECADNRPILASRRGNHLGRLPDRDRRLELRGRVADSLRHRYIVEIRGPDKFNAGQFVDQRSVFRSPGYGLALYLAFEPSAGREREVRFLACRESDLFQLFPWHGIPCYAARFGVDVSTAARVHWAVATAVYYNVDSMDLKCCIHDEHG